MRYNKGEMKKIGTLFFLSFLLMGSSCDFLVSKEEGSSSSSSVITGDRGYLKIKPEWRDYFTTDYVFIGEEGHQFLAEGKNEEGKDAFYTFVATWESSDESILHIDNRGCAKGVSNGVVTLKATYKQYSDEITVRVATCAEEHEVLEIESYYRTKNTYEMPYRVSPSDALVEYTFSEEDTIEVLDNGSFIPKKSGSVEVTARVYIDERGRPRQDKFTLNIIENEKPYFVYEEEEKEELKLDIAARKYQSLDWNALGISAFAGDDDSDITSSIQIKSGSYDLSRVGEYPLLLSVVNKGVEATLPFTLNIIEKERVVTKFTGERIEFDQDSLNIRIASDLKSITFSVTAILPSDYEEMMGSVGLNVICVVKQKVSGERITLTKYESTYFAQTTKKRIAASVTCVTENNTEMRAGNENVVNYSISASLNGYGFNYITYPLQEPGGNN